MAKVLFINKFGNNVVKDMEFIPRIGDTVGLFYKPYPKVSDVVWFHENVLPALKDQGVDVVITVE